MISIIESVVFIKKYVSQFGTTGILYNKVLQKLHENSCKETYKIDIFWKLGIHIAQKYLITDGYSFKFQTDGKVINLIDYSEEYLSQIYENLICIAPISNIWKEFGIENISDMPIEDSNVHDILQKTVASGYDGFIVSDSITNAHNNMDKLVHLGLVVKRTVQAQRLSKYAIHHSKYYAKNFEPTNHGYKLIVHKSYLERVSQRILMILDENNVSTMPLKKLSLILGLNPREMRYIRDAITSLNKTASFSTMICFDEIKCNQTHAGTSLSNLYCVSKVSPYSSIIDIGNLELNFQCQRNIPIYETAAIAIESTNGITSNHLRRIIGCNTSKKSQKIFFDLNKRLLYPLEKFQAGKQLLFKLISKSSERNYQEQNSSMIDTTQINITNKSNVNSNSIVPDEFEGIPAALIEQKHSLDKSKHSMRSAEINLTTQTVNQHAHLLTEEQKLNAKIVIDYLHKDSTEGLCSFSEINSEIRRFHRNSINYEGNKIDKLTIKRVIARLESEHIIEPIEAIDPRVKTIEKGGETNNSGSLLKLYKLKGHKLTDEIISNYFKKTTSDTTTSTALHKRERNEDDSDLMEYNKIRKLNRTSSKIDDVYLFDHQSFTEVIYRKHYQSNNIPNVGICVSCIVLHYHISQICKCDNEITESTLNNLALRFTMADLQLELPIHFFLKFTRIFHFLEFDNDYVVLFIKSLNSAMLVKDWLSLENTLSSQPFHLFLNSIKLEFVKMICFLASTGILQVLDFNLFYSFLSKLKNKQLDEIITTREISDQIEVGNINQRQMELFAKLYEYFDEFNCDMIALPTEVSLLSNYIFLDYFVVNTVPVGSLIPLIDPIDIYHHWKVIVLPSLPFDWDSFQTSNSLSKIGVFTLVHNIKTGKGNSMPDLKEFDQALLKGVRISKSLNLQLWGIRSITEAWRHVKLMNWKSLCCSELHCNTFTEIEVVNSSINDSNLTEMDYNGDRVDVLDKAVVEIKKILPDDFLSYIHDDQLDEEITTCFSSLTNDFNTKQTAIMLEAFLLCFINKPSTSMLPKVLLIQNESSVDKIQTSEVIEYINPSVSYLDIIWKDIDFTFVADCTISSAVSFSKIPIYYNTIMKKRIIQFFRVKSKFIQIAAWILCNKGSAPSISFMHTMNLILNHKDNINTIPGISKVNQVIPLIIQHCIDYSSRSHITNILKINYSSECIKRAFREMYIRDYIRKRKVCDLPTCGNYSLKQSGKRCSHQKHYELTEIFYDSLNNTLLSPFYKVLLKYKETYILNSMFHCIESELFRDSFPTQIAILYHFISSNPNICFNDIDLSTKNNHKLFVKAFNLPDETETEDSYKVLFSKENYSSRGSTFCQKQLNTIEIKTLINLKYIIPLSNNNNQQSYNDITDANKNLNKIINNNTLEQFAAKALSIIAERPGVSTSQLHTHLKLLSLNQTFELARNLEEKKLIVARNCSSKIFLTSPFDIKNIFSKTVLESNKNNTTNIYYFLQNKLI